PVGEGAQHAFDRRPRDVLPGRGRQRQIEQARGRVGTVWSAFTFEPRLQDEPTGPGGCLQRQCTQLCVVDAEQAADRVEDSGRVQRRDDGQKSSGCVRENGNGLAGGGYGCGSRGEDGSARADGYNDISATESEP